MTRPGLCQTIAAALLLCATSDLLACGLWIDDDKLQGTSYDVENDYFGRARHNTDRWYTNGLHCAWAYRRDADVPLPYAWVRELGTRWFDIAPASGPARVSGFLGQNIYTPRNITTRERQPYDRPYAGLLMTGVSSDAYRGRDAHRALDLRLGVVGPAALGREVQTNFHRLIHQDLPQGWDHQLRPRLLLQGSVMETYLWTPGKGSVLPDWLGLHWHNRLTVGTVRNVLATGLTLVAGERRRVFGAPDEGEFIAVDVDDRRNDFPNSWLRAVTFIAQAQIAGVANNYLIDGATYGARPQVDARHQLWMLTLGASLRLTPAWRLEYRVKRRSAEFTTPFGLPDGRIQNYGEVRVVHDFEPGPATSRPSVR